MLNHFAKIDLHATNTPLEYMENLTQHLGGPKIYFKRDDLNGFALGGNKLRKLEYLLADVLKNKAEAIVVSGGIHSNFIRLLVAGAAKIKVPVIAVFYGDAPEKAEGNYLLIKMVGCKTVFTHSSDRASSEVEAKKIFDSMEANGEKPYFISRGGASAIGCLGYFEFVRELHAQAQSFDHLVVPTGSCGTLAGILLGSHYFRLSQKIWGFSVSRSKEECEKRVNSLAEETRLGLGIKDQSASENCFISDSFLGAGYGVPSAEGEAAIKMVAELEGVFLDPVFTGKAFAGLISLIKTGKIRSDESVIFLHTGGSPNLFVSSKNLVNL